MSNLCSHFLVSAREVAIIEANKSREHCKGTRKVPYLVREYGKVRFQIILKNRIVQVAILNAFGELVATGTFLTYSPLYFRAVLKVSFKIQKGV